MQITECSLLLQKLMPPKKLAPINIPGIFWNGTCWVYFILSRKKIKAVALFDAVISQSPASGVFSIRFHDAEIDQRTFDKTRDSLSLNASMTARGWRFSLSGFKYCAYREIIHQRMPSMFLLEY